MPDYSFYRNASQGVLVAEAEAHEGALYGTDGATAADTPANELLWSFEEYPLERIKHGGGDIPNTPADWELWFKGELEYARMSGREALYRSMVESIEEPVILVEDEEGIGFLWEGCHRTGASCLAKRTSIPAIVGRRLARIGQVM